MSLLRQALSSRIYRFRGPLIVIAVLLVTATTAAALAAFGDSGIEEIAGLDNRESGQRVRTAGERCGIPLLEGWTWRPAAWTLLTPGGTTVGLYETLHGRPQYPEWDEMVDDTLSRYEGRDDVDITREPEYVRLDFGDNGGLSVIRRFDRVGCHLSFSPPSSEVRAQEIEQWEALVASVERTYPQE